MGRSTRKRVEFRLTMPNVGSWNGRWSGEDRNYTIVRRLPDERIRDLGIPRSWRYDFGDGWVAGVSARVMDKGGRRAKSDGFCGYEWMVENILRWGTPECQHEFRPDPNSGKPGYEGEWERCRWCSMSRKVDTAATEVAP